MLDICCTVFSMDGTKVRDTIPRLHRVLDHAGDQLIGLAAGADTFEDCRRRYLETQQRLVREGRGRLTASRIADHERNWAPTRDCLQELMRWGAIEQLRLPSERKFVDGYRRERYPLTELGHSMATIAKKSRAEFTDAVTNSIIAAHPYVRGLLEALEAEVVAYPVISEGDIQRGRDAKRRTSDWAAWAAERIAGGPTEAMVLTELQKGLMRFHARRTPETKPTNKELSEAMNDAFAAAGFAARGLDIDATTIKALLRWGSELLLYDQSRYVPAYPQATVIWGCSTLKRTEDQRLLAQRRGLAAFGRSVAGAIVRAYEEQAAADDSRMAAPFLAVHRVRAQVACEIGVTRRLVDRVLVDLVDGAFADIAANAAVFIGNNTQLPDSEPAFRYRGGRRLVLQITPTTAA
jgi:hypothetical protein